MASRGKRRGCTSPCCRSMAVQAPADDCSGTTGAQVQEQGQALPAPARLRERGVIWHPWLAERFNDEPGVLQRKKIVLQRLVAAVEGHRQSVAFDPVAIAEGSQIASA